MLTDVQNFITVSETWQKNCSKLMIIDHTTSQKLLLRYAVKYLASILYHSRVNNGQVLFQLLLLLYHMLGIWLCGVDVRNFTEADGSDGRRCHRHRYCRQLAWFRVEAALKNFTSTGFMHLLHASVLYILGCNDSYSVIHGSSEFTVMLHSYASPTSNGHLLTEKLSALSFN